MASSRAAHRSSNCHQPSFHACACCVGRTTSCCRPGQTVLIDARLTGTDWGPDGLNCTRIRLFWSFTAEFSSFGVGLVSFSLWHLVSSWSKKTLASDCCCRYEAYFKLGFGTMEKLYLTGPNFCRNSPKLVQDFLERCDLLKYTFNVLIIISSCMRTPRGSVFPPAWFDSAVVPQLKAGPTWSCVRSSSSQREPLRWWRASATEAADPDRRPGGRLLTGPCPARAARYPQTQRRWPGWRWAAPSLPSLPRSLLPSRSIITTDFHFVDLLQLISFWIAHFLYSDSCRFLSPFDLWIRVSVFVLLICHRSPDSPTYNTQLW